MTKRFKLEDFLPFRLNVLAQDVSERLSGIYADRFDLDIPRWRILANLASRGALTAQDIVRITISHKSTISRAAQELEERGLIKRTLSQKDRRAYSLSLTPAGRKLFRQLLPLVLAFEEELMRSMAPVDAKALLRGVAALEASMNKTRKETP